MARLQDPWPSRRGTARCGPDMNAGSRCGQRRLACALSAALVASASFAASAEARLPGETHWPAATRPAATHWAKAALWPTEVHWAAEARSYLQKWKTITKSRTVTGEEELRVRISYGAGVLTVRPATDRNLLYQARIRFDEDAVLPKLDYENGRLRVGVASLEGRRARGLGREGREDKLDLRLPTSVPVDLDISFGAGHAELDLTGVPLERMEMSTGASESVVRIDEPNPMLMESAVFEVGAADFRISGLGNLNAERVAVRAGVGAVTLDLQGSWQTEARLVVDMGLGALMLRVPESLGVRVRRDAPRFLASFDLDGMVKRDDGHYSLNWDDADHKLDIEITAALGSVDLRWVP